MLMRKNCLAALEDCWRLRDLICSLRLLQWWHFLILIYLTFHLTTSGQSKVRPIVYHSVDLKLNIAQRVKLCSLSEVCCVLCKGFKDSLHCFLANVNSRWMTPIATKYSGTFFWTRWIIIKHLRNISSQSSQKMINIQNAFCRISKNIVIVCVSTEKIFISF